MKTSQKVFLGVLTAVAVLALVIGSVALVGGNQSADLGASTPGTRFPHGVTFGDPSYSPTNLALVKAGTCTILADASVAATSTKNFDCAFTGARSGDIVVAALQASSTLASQYVIKGVTASSTADYLTFSILNLTGGAAVPAATNGFGSSTQVELFRAQ